MITTLPTLRNPIAKGLDTGLEVSPAELIQRHLAGSQDLQDAKQKLIDLEQRRGAVAAEHAAAVARKGAISADAIDRVIAGGRCDTVSLSATIESLRSELDVFDAALQRQRAAVEAVRKSVAINVCAALEPRHRAAAAEFVRSAEAAEAAFVAMELIAGSVKSADMAVRTLPVFGMFQTDIRAKLKNAVADYRKWLDE